jgi:protein PhnA
MITKTRISGCLCYKCILFYQQGYFMEQLPKCPKCGSEYTYEDGDFYICPECAHEWSKDAGATEDAEVVVRDANGTVLQDGDTVTVIKDLKVKGASSDIKVGTKVKNIRLVPENDHNIDCKIPGIGAMGLKSEFVKKV